MADRWFVRVDISGIVIHGYTDDFQEPQVGDIEITDQAAGRWGRHFDLRLFDDENRPMWKMVDGILQPRAREELEDAAYLEKRKRQAIRAAKEVCNRSIEDQWDAIEVINRLMLVIDKLLIKTGETAPAKYSNMKATIDPLTAARDSKVAQIKACATVADLDALLGVI